jgi:hypothetical protein
MHGAGSDLLDKSWDYSRQPIGEVTANEPCTSKEKPRPGKPSSKEATAAPVATRQRPLECGSA